MVHAPGHSTYTSGSNTTVEAPQHEEEFPLRPIPEWFIIVFALTSVFLVIGGVIGNALIVAAVLRVKRLRTVANFFILNLAIKDILALGFVLPAYIPAVVNKKYPYSFTTCLAGNVLSTATLMGSAFDLTTIATNRYIIICKPQFRAKFYNSKLTVFALASCTWVLGILSALPMLLKPIEFHSILRVCSIANKCQISHFVPLLVSGIPILSFCAFCYVQIFKKVATSKRNLDRHQLEENSLDTGSTFNMNNGHIRNENLNTKRITRATSLQAVDENKELVCDPCDPTSRRRSTSGDVQTNEEPSPIVLTPHALPQPKEMRNVTGLWSRLHSKKSQPSASSRQINKLRLEFIVFLLFMLLSLPYCILRMFVFENMVASLLLIFSYLLVFANNFVNCILYGFMNRPMRIAIKEMLGWKMCCEKQVGTTVSRDTGYPEDSNV